MGLGREGSGRDDGKRLTLCCISSIAVHDNTRTYLVGVLQHHGHPCKIANRIVELLRLLDKVPVDHLSRRNGRLDGCLVLGCVVRAQGCLFDDVDDILDSGFAQAELGKCQKVGEYSHWDHTFCSWKRPSLMLPTRSSSLLRSTIQSSTTSSPSSPRCRICVAS